MNRHSYACRFWFVARIGERGCPILNFRIKFVFYSKKLNAAPVLVNVLAININHLLTTNTTIFFFLLLLHLFSFILAECYHPYTSLKPEGFICFATNISLSTYSTKSPVSNIIPKFLSGLVR